MEAHAIFGPLDLALVSIVDEFNQQLDDNSANISRAKALILELAERLEQLGTSPNTVSISIKRILAAKIAERKISARWIHSCLPPEWKRAYRKRELNSLSAVTSEKEMHNFDEGEGNAENIVVIDACVPIGRLENIFMLLSYLKKKDIWFRICIDKNSDDLLAFQITEGDRT